MTETERIVAQGIVDADFLKPEVRDEYEVTAEAKKIWAIEIDLLRKFDEVCRKHGLRYWAGFGTMLGAVRHHGFIPWDDDVDVWMPREDYNKLLKLPQSEFGAPFFLQTTMNDDDYYSAFARLRNSNTTGILVSKYNKCNNGIYMDIYPLDGLHPNKNLQMVNSYNVRIRNLMAHAYMFNINPRLITRIISKVLRSGIIPFNHRKTYQKVNRIAMKRKWADASEGGIVVFWPYAYAHNHFRKDAFQDTVYLPFEHISVPVPSGYKHVLRVLYGDFMKFPPVEQRGQWHDFFFEPDVDYKTYCSEHYGTKYQ